MLWGVWGVWVAILVYFPTASVTPDRMGRPSEIVKKIGDEERPVLFSQQNGARGAPHEGARDEVGGGITLNEMGGALAGRGPQARAYKRVQHLIYYY